MAEKNVSSWGRADVVIKLIDKGFGVDDSVEAARNCGDLQRSVRYLSQGCPLCITEYPMSQVCVSLLHKSSLIHYSIFAHSGCVCYG